MQTAVNILHKRTPTLSAQVYRLLDTCDLVHYQIYRSFPHSSDPPNLPTPNVSKSSPMTNDYGSVHTSTTLCMFNDGHTYSVVTVCSIFIVTAAEDSQTDTTEIVAVAVYYNYEGIMLCVI